MRDYCQIAADLRAEGTPSAIAGAEALDELSAIARRMTALGVDLENEIQEDLTADVFADGGFGLQYLYFRERLADLGKKIPAGVPFRLKALKVIGDSWFVFFEEDGPGSQPREFFTEEEARASVTKETEMTFT